MTQDNILDVAIIGAGPSGLVIAKQFAATNANFKVYEQNARVGGIWNIDAPNSPMYESAHFISSRTLSAFPGFPMPSSYPDYPNHKQLLDYIESYAAKYQLHQHISFNAPIAHAKQNSQGLWELQLASGEVALSRYLVCANGVTWQPNTVNWEGQFNGEVRHTVTYRSSHELKGKRVLVVGAGNSGVDIACDAAFAAEQAFLSVRRGYHFVPKHIMGKPTDVFGKSGPKLPFWLNQKIFGGLLRFINGDLSRYGLPKPDHKLFQTHPIMNTQILHYLGHGDCIAKPDVERLDGDDVIFKDGSREKIDLILTATGYKHSAPFLDDNVVEEQNGRPSLYMNMFPRQYTNLAFLGFIEFASAAYENFTVMAELIVADAMGKVPKLADKKVHHFPDLTGGHHYLSTERNANYVDVDTYLKTLANIKQELGLVTSR